MRTISDTDFSDLIYQDMRDFVSLSRALSGFRSDEVTRRLIGRLQLEASKCEELLDAFGANHNDKWSPVRKAVAVAKAFSRVIYNLHHIRLSAPGYQLLEVEGDFTADTLSTLDSLNRVIVAGAASFMTVAHRLEIDQNLRDYESYPFDETVIEGRLAPSQKRKSEKHPRENAVYLATHFLNLAEDSSWLDVYSKLDPDEYESAIPEVVSEEKVRSLSNRFHNLQSLYDTYLSGSDITEKDHRLPVMRGQITVVFHLLDTAVTVVHFYERHAMKSWEKKLKAPVGKKDLLGIIMDYFIAYADKYITAAQTLCREIIQSYAVPGEIEVPIPNYRGFHVRPSTLVAKIAIHYGSEVIMRLGNAEYDASLPLELFRANEELNRRKRDAVAKSVMEHKLVKNDAGACYEEILMKKILRVIFLDLLEKQKIMLYDNDFSFEDIAPYENETLAEFIKRGIALYLALGKIDIVSGDKVTFLGDKRVLQDIEVLANNGYGEDRFGNNIVLPSELSYLKR